MINLLTLDTLFRLLFTGLLLSIISYLFTRQVACPNKSVVLGILFRFILAWIGFSIVGFLFAKFLIMQFLPSVSWVIGRVQHDYTVQLFVNGQYGKNIQMLSTLTVPAPPLNQGDTIRMVSSILPVVMLLVTIYSFLMAWPANSFGARIKLLVLSSPVSFMLVTGVMSLQLIAVNEFTLQILAEKFNLAREQSFFLTSFDFIKNSDAWLRSIALAILGSAVFPKPWLKYK